MEPFIYLNGAVIPAAEARISPLDRGLLYGDGLFETMRTYGGGIHLLGRHLARLRSGCDFLGIALPADEELIGSLRAVVSANGTGDMVLRLTVTRGVGGSVAELSASDGPLILITSRPAPARHNQTERIISLSIRRVISGYGSTLKSLNYLPVVIAARELREAGVREGVMVTEEGWVAEGTVSNIFCVYDGELFTPPLELGVLAGITRQRITELALREGVTVREERFTITDLHSSEECFTTNSVREIVAAGSLDDIVFGDGAPGPVTQLLLERYRAEIPMEFL